MAKKNKKFNAVIKTSGRRKKRRRFSFTRKFLFSKYGVGTLVFLLVAGTLVYYAFFSGEFLIKNVGIEGVKPELSAEVQGFYEKTANKERFIFLKQNNIFLFPKESFETSLLNTIPRLKTVNAEIEIPDSLEIRAEERVQKGIWCNYHSSVSVSKCYFYDTEGVIYEEAPNSSRGSLIVAIRDTRHKETSLPQKVLEGEMKEYIEQLTQALEFGYRRPEYLRIESKNDIRAGFSEGSASALSQREGWEAYFSRREDIISSVENLILVTEQEIGARAPELEYIDLRLGNKVFYKYKEAESEELSE